MDTDQFFLICSDNQECLILYNELYSFHNYVYKKQYMCLKLSKYLISKHPIFNFRDRLRFIILDYKYQFQISQSHLFRFILKKYQLSKKAVIFSSRYYIHLNQKSIVSYSFVIFFTILIILCYTSSCYTRTTACNCVFIPKNVYKKRCYARLKVGRLFVK